MKDLLKKLNKFLISLRGLIFIVFFVISLASLTAYIVHIKEQENVSLIENRNLVTFEDIETTTFLDNSFQNQLEEAFKDQFIERYSLVNIKKRIDNQIAIFLRGKNLEEEASITEIAGTGLYQLDGTNYVLLGLVGDSEEYRNRYIEKADEINQLAADYPNVNVYVYYPTQVHETSLFDDEEKGLKSYGPEYYEIYSNALNVEHTRLEINSVNDYKEYFYEQDHHWNYRGSYQGYLDIIEMIFDGEEEPLVPTELVTSNDKLKWYGTMGSRTGYILEPEIFYYYKYNLKDYKCYVDGVEQPVNNMNNIEDQLLSDGEGYYYTNLGANNFYDQHFVTSYPEKETLLIIGDSYASAIEPLLCQHFSEIYFIQPSNYRWIGHNGKCFDYDKFINETHIDNILIMYTGENYFLDDTYDNFLMHRGAK